MAGVVDPTVSRHVQRLRDKYGSRDMRMSKIRAVREGNMDVLFPDLFGEDWRKPIVANFIDIAAKDFSEAIAPLPTLTCPVGDMSSDSSRRFANKKTRFGLHYWLVSRLEQRMAQAVDRYMTYGFMPILVEPDFDTNLPMLSLEDPWGSYPDLDRYGTCKTYAKVWKDKASNLAVDFPDLADQLYTREYGQWKDCDLEVVRFFDTDYSVTFIPERKNLILGSPVQNLISRCPVSVAKLPHLDDEFRGQFDQVIWVQMARAKMAVLQLEAAQKAVNAPTVVPEDLDDLPLGDDAIWRTREGVRSVGRVPLAVDPAIFSEMAELEQELRTGARYPEARTGNINASVITGRGVQELLGGFDSQIKTAQTQIGAALREATSIAFEVDEKYFGGTTKNVTGVAKGSPYQVKYDPAKDIDGDYTCQVTYGYMAGLTPNQALVFMLQLRADKDLSQRTMMENLPYDVDVESELRQITVEEARAALNASVLQTAQAIPALAAQGQAPTQIVKSIATYIQQIQRGDTPEDAANKAFTPPEPENGPETMAEGGQEEPGAAPAGVQMPEQNPYMQPISQLLAGIRNGSPVLSQEVRKRQPA